MCAVAQAVLATVLQPEFIPHINTISSYLKHSLEKLSTDFSLGEVRGKGLLIALDTSSVSATSIVEQAREQGLLLNAPNIQTLRFMPALTITESEIDTAIEQLRQVLTHLKTQRCG